MKKFWILIYYVLAIRLPKSTTPIVGRWSRRLRYHCACHLFSECNGFVNLEQGAYIGNGARFFVKHGDVGIGKNFCSHNRIVTFLGNLMMAEEVMFVGGGHSFQDPSKSIGSEPDITDVPLEICEDVWIGARAMILPGCKRIGAHSIVGAGAVVTHDVPDYAVVGGNPAQVIRMRK